MSKRYVLNPETGRLVNEEGCAGLKIINQLLKQKKQVKYQLKKSNNTCKEGEKKVLRTINGEKKRICVPKTTLRAKCPKGEIKHEGKCIKKQDKPKATRERPKNNCKEGEKKVLRTINGEKKRICVPKTTLRAKCPKGEIKHEGKCIKKHFLQKYDKIVKEIKSVYNPIKKRVDYIDDLYDGHPHDYPDELYIDFEKLKKKMPEFVKFSGFSDKKIKQIMKSCLALRNMSELNNPVVYLEYVLNSILAGEPSSDMRFFHDYFRFPK